MKIQIKRLISISAIAAMLTQTMAVPAYAGISNLPPLVKPNVFPNIFFTLDDSGSMMFEHMPDSIASGYTVGFPQPSGVYASGVNAANIVIPFGDGVGNYNSMTLKIARYRNSEVNAIYYNPETRYDPWVDASGVPMAPADPLATLFNPVAPNGGALVQTINLTTSSQSSKWGSPNWERSTSTTLQPEARNFYPATYFKFNNGVGCGSAETATNASCFTRVEITSTVSTYPKGADRTDCGADTVTTCTYAQEIQNFANWFQYWRSRMLMARGGTGVAFGKQTSSIRVGFGAINAGSKSINGVSSTVILNGVTDDFSGANRLAFYDQLYKYPAYKNSTPLRTATGKVGQYFSRKDYGGPWANKINDSSKGQATCRQNYHILMTDGYWNEGNPGRGNIDGTDGSLMTAANGDTFKYTTTGTFYTKKDQPTVFTPAKQYSDSHKDTLADAAMQYWKNDLRADWGTSSKNVPTNSRDPAFWQHLVTYTVGLGVVGTLDPATDLPALTDGTLSWSAPASDSVNNVDDLWHAAVNGRGQYFSAKDPKQFGDSLSAALNDIAGRAGNSAAVGTSSNTVASGTKLYMTTYNTQNWDGTLKQLNINSTGGVDTVPDWVVNSTTVWPTRNIYTYKDNSTKGVPFEFSNLATTDQTFFTTAKSTLFGGSVTEDDIVNYLKGNQSKEKNKTNGVFRIRTNLLGDLVGSSPQYVGQGGDEGYIYLPTTTPDNGKSSYFNFYSVIKKNRPARVYVGANDGMLHAFNATTGAEEFAYVPKTVMENLPKLADPAYTHRFYVDGTPTIADAYLGGWKTVLVGTTGAGGKGVYALDITSGTGFDASKVLWEVNSSNDAEIGYTIGRPQVGRVPNGDWVAIFGNGYESASKKAMLFIVNLSTGAISKVNTGAGSTAAPNGLATPRLMIDSTGTIKTAYAGDLLGNMWKFDFTTSGASVAFSGSSLFQAKDASNKPQPITVQPDVIGHPKGGVLVTFGTGKLFESEDPATTDTQSIYGIWDKVGISGVTPSPVSSLTNLVQQTQTTIGTGLTLLSNNPVDYATKRGWYINLPAGERVTIDPAVIYSAVLYTTITPGSVTDPCLTNGTSMNLLFDPITGGRINFITFDTDKSGVIDSSDVKASGMQIPLTFGTTVLRRKGGIALAQPGADGTLGGGGPGPGPCISNCANLPPIPALRLWRQILGRN